jgi:hypothetical protein
MYITEYKKQRSASSMSYQEKRTIGNIISGVLVLASYCIYAFSKYQSGAIAPDNLRLWALTMLMFIGLGIVITIVIQIILHIMMAISIAIKEKKCDEKEITRTIEASDIEDEMDKLIELKSMRIGFVFAGVGFVAALVSLVLNCSPAVMLNLIFLSFSIGSLSEGFLSLHYYKKGVENG